MSKMQCRRGKRENRSTYGSSVNSIAAWVTSQPRSPNTTAIASFTLRFCWVYVLLAGRSWRNRPAPGTEPEMPKWMAGVNPKNLLLAAGAGSALALIGPSTAEAVVSLVVFVLIGSLTIAGPVVFYLVGGDRAKTQPDSVKGWLAVHNDPVMTVLFLVFGVNLITKGIRR
jgi:hypothetical protein